MEKKKNDRRRIQPNPNPTAGDPQVFACDRWGSSEMMNRVFTGFAALPETAGQSNDSWWAVLGFDSPYQTEEDVKRAYRKLSKLHHPDLGGDESKMTELSAAYREAMAIYK